jgi:hypothetical protein
MTRLQHMIELIQGFEESISAKSESEAATLY